MVSNVGLPLVLPTIEKTIKKKKKEKRHWGKNTKKNGDDKENGGQRIRECYGSKKEEVLLRADRAPIRKTKCEISKKH